MAKDVNKLTLTGRLGRDPEMRYTTQGTAVTTFSLATTTGYGEHEKTEWTDCVAWDKLAEITNKHLVKGSRVYVEGSKETRSYEDKDGNKRYKVELIVRDFVFLEGKNTANDEEAVPAPKRAPNKPAPAVKPRNAPQAIEEDTEGLPF